jgi:hypothetical protein
MGYGKLLAPVLAWAAAAGCSTTTDATVPVQEADGSLDLDAPETANDAGTAGPDGPTEAAQTGSDARSTSNDSGGSSDSSLVESEAAESAGHSDASDAGASDSRGAESGVSAGWVPSIVAVGYGGLRVISRDNGMTWADDQEFESSGGDDHDLLRGIAYGNGTWVTTGWRLFTSIDGGLTWSEHALLSDCGLMEGVAFGAGTFVGTCGTDAYLSPDGVAWSHAGPVGDTTGHTYVFFAAGLFYSSGDSGKSYSSQDGQTWTELAGVTKVAYCESAIRTQAECPGFWNQGAYFSSEWESKITRSTDGVNFSTVYDNAKLNPGNNAPYTNAFAVGLSPP